MSDALNSRYQSMRRATRQAFGGWALAFVLMGAAGFGCTGAVQLADAPSESRQGERIDDALCPATRDHAGRLPGVDDAHLRLDYWLSRPELAGLLDQVIVSDAARSAHNASIYRRAMGAGRMLVDLSEPFDETTELGVLNARFESFRGEFADGKYFNADGSTARPLVEGRLDSIAAFPAADASGNRSYRVAAGRVALRCAPTLASFYTESLDPAFDRNNCSTLHAGEPLVLLGRIHGLRLARSAYALGWIADDAPLSAPLTREAIAPFVHGESAEVTREMVVQGTTLAEGTRVVLVGAGSLPSAAEASTRTAPIPVVYAAAEGLKEAEIAVDSLRSRQEPLTRRTYLTYLFSMLGEPYAWGDEGGGRDCSRLVMDSLDAFGVRLPRQSSAQSYAGDFYVDVAAMDADEKLKILDAANQRGIVLLHFPGHIMVYLGRNEAGVPMAFHTFAEYYEPCTQDPRCASTDACAAKTLVRAHQTTVTTLALGEGTDRGSFFERVNRITVIGETPGDALEGVATLREPVPPVVPENGCTDTDERAIFSAPYHANLAQDTWISLVSDAAFGPAAMVARSPSGRVVELAAERRFGPPWALVARTRLDEVGTWRVVVGDGTSVLACKDVRVRSARTAVAGGGEHAWPLRNAWDRRFENYFSFFVSELSRYPLDEGRTWGNLHDLLREASKNPLFDYLGRGEEQALTLQPDCADLPYVLRAYFAWKMGLPFAYRSCSRGREGRPPMCGDPQTNLQSRAAPGPVEAFQHFARRSVMSGVHSGNGRTSPVDSQTDLYPVPLTRDALRPGVVYADPDGHVMMIARWEAQGRTGTGQLIAIDAQPDGTIGLRPFWRGTFGFRPETDSVGAGFKAFRPVIVGRDGVVRTLLNEELQEGRWYYPHSLVAYEGNADAFYDTMDALISPRPLDAWGAQLRLIDALEASFAARVRAVELGTDYMRRAQWREVTMPRGYAIFETSGPWEDFATPSRDLRLLIAMDAALGFVDRLARNPEHYGLSEGDVSAAQAELREKLREELAARTVTYTRSDKTPWTLTLAELAARRTRFEVAYNLNDCPEYRWGAEVGSEEYAPCAGRASDAQQQRLAEYQAWFSARRRPAR